MGNKIDESVKLSMDVEKFCENLEVNDTEELCRNALRDQIALETMKILLVQDTNFSPRTIAEESYELADEMIRARGGKSSG